MKKVQFLTMIIAITALVFSLNSCKKDRASADETEANSYVKDAQVEDTFDELGRIADEAWSGASAGLKSTGNIHFNFAPCATVTIDTVSMPHVMTIDFGDENCLCRDGKYRRGQIIVTFTGRYREPGTVRTHTLSNYYVNNNYVQGNSVITNMGFNDDEHIYFTIVAEGSVTFAEGEGTISWESDRVRTWVEGYATIGIWADDVYLIEGTASITHLNGNTTTREIIIPLRRELSCHHFVSGSVEITPTNRPVSTLDYGDGNCDNIATVTINGNTFTIRLK